MATPTLDQARSSQVQQRAIVAAAVLAIRSLIQRRAPLADVATAIASYQFAAALAAIRTVAGWGGAPTSTVPQAFAGVSSMGFPVIEPVISTIDRFDPAPPEALPAPWWDDAAAFMAQVEQLIASEVQDAARTASQVEMAAQGWTEYVRLLNLPSCDRCVILAGRVYRYSKGFDRHPGCDCVMVPVDDLEAAKAEGLVADPMEAFERGLIGGMVTLDDGSQRFKPSLSKADMRAIRDGADITTVVNARRAGMRAPAGITSAVTVDAFGRRVKATTYGTTVRAAWRRANPTRLVRLRPESIYAFAQDREDAIRLLRLYGYLSG